ncbi:hypothetical protein [Leptolyngbya sp. 7M]|uniref:hypothetical protein n=1 Tax=Leptolyngbya sp. 7M TaxID=2812896 RepID=UPI001B8D857F|nr:hypothetical protein [Leptolyngbya sp. 7M]QYO62172.1 hypothetical protein JVX88_18850 [Leptolyngbya sp. 7M]
MAINQRTITGARLAIYFKKQMPSAPLPLGVRDFTHSERKLEATESDQKTVADVCNTHYANALSQLLNRTIN